MMLIMAVWIVKGELEEMTMVLLLNVMLQVILCRPVVVNTAPAHTRGPRNVRTGSQETPAATSSASRGRARCVGASLEGELHSVLLICISLCSNNFTHQGMDPAPTD